MVRRIRLSEEDKKHIDGIKQERDPSLENIDFKGFFVNKPWGYEYLMFQNNEIAIWLLYIKIL